MRTFFAYRSFETLALLDTGHEDCHFIWAQRRQKKTTEFQKSDEDSVKVVKKLATFLGMDGCSLYVSPQHYRKFVESYALDMRMSMASFYREQAQLESDQKQEAPINVSKPRPRAVHDLLIQKSRCAALATCSDEDYLTLAHQVIPMLPRFYLVEINGHQWSDVLRVWFELDIKSKDESVLQTLETQFTEPSGFVQTLSRHMITFLRQCYPDHGKSMHMSVIADKRIGGVGQKAVKISQDKSETIYTTGIHLHATELFVTIRDLLNLRHAFVQYLDQEMPLSTYSLYNCSEPQDPVQWGCLIDLSPINPNKGLRMPGSFKCDRCTECGNQQAKRLSCQTCHSFGYIHINKFYWPCTWTYEHLPDCKMFINSTEFVSQKKDPTTVFEIVAIDLPQYDLRHLNMIYLTSIKLNGATIACGEEGQEKPFEYRRTPTAGLRISIKSAPVNKGKRKNMVRSEDDTIDPCIEVKKQQVGYLFEARRDSDQRYTEQVRKAISQCVNPWSTSNLVNDQVPSPAGAKKLKPNPFGKAAANMSQTTVVDTSKKVQRWKDIEIGRVQAFMVRLQDPVRQEVLKTIPLKYQTTEFVEKWKTLPYVLCGYISPIKNEVSKRCPFKTGFDPMHSKNNVFFQFMVPVINQDIKTLSPDERHPHEFDMDNMAAWAARLLNQLRHTPEDLKLPQWFIRVRCFSEKCKGEHTDYGMPWKNLLTLIEPILQRMLVEAHYRLQTHKMEYTKE